MNRNVISFDLIRLVASALFISLLLISCGGGSSGEDTLAKPVDNSQDVEGSIDSNESVTIIEGVFVPSVKGLSYRCSDGRTDTTKDDGKITCIDGEKVEFNLFGYELGSVQMREYFSPIRLTKNQESALNIAQLLMMLDKDSYINNGFEIDEVMGARLEFYEISLDTADFDEQTSAFFEVKISSEEDASKIFNAFLQPVGEPNFNVIDFLNDDDETVDSVYSSTYDENGRLLTDSMDFDGDGVIDSVTTYTYNANGNLISFSTDDGNDGTVDSVYSSTYDENGRLLTDSMDFDGDGVIDSVTTYTYDSDGSLISISTDD